MGQNKKRTKKGALVSFGEKLLAKKSLLKYAFMAFARQ